MFNFNIIQTEEPESLQGNKATILNYRWLWTSPSIPHGRLTISGGIFDCHNECTRVTGQKSEMLLSMVAWTGFSSVQSLSRVQLFVTSWITACQASLCIINFQSLHKLMSIESVMPSSHLILCCPLHLLPPIPPSIRIFSNQSTLRKRWPKYWSFSFRISPYNEHPGLISFRMDWLDLLQAKGCSRIFSNTTVQKHQFFSAQLSSQSNSHIHTWQLEKP